MIITKRMIKIHNRNSGTQHIDNLNDNLLVYEDNFTDLLETKAMGVESDMLPDVRSNEVVAVIISLWCVCVWVCGCVGVWVCGCVGVWVGNLLAVYWPTLDASQSNTGHIISKDIHQPLAV